MICDSSKLPLPAVVTPATIMDSSSQTPNRQQQQKLCEMLHMVLVDIRALSWGGQSEQAADLADAFHNLPHEMWRDHFTFTDFRNGFLLPYYQKWPVHGSRDYLVMLDQVEELGDA